MKKIISALLPCLLFASLFTGCSKSDSSNNPGSPAGGSANTVSIGSMSFSPASKTVAKGTVVKWTNNSSYDHTVTSNDGTTFGSVTLNPGNSFSYTANTPGTFTYHCTIHGLGMSGTLVVNP